MSFPTRSWAFHYNQWAGPPGVLLLLLLTVARVAAATDVTNQSPIALSINLGSPSLMNGTFYEIGSHQKTVLFKYQRQATRVGELIEVSQTFTLPDGTIACRETIHYRMGLLVNYAMEDFRAQYRGSIVIEPDPKKPGRERIMLEFLKGAGTPSKVSKGSEILQPNTLISDTVYPHVLDHWDELLAGTTVKFHFISLDPAATFNFKLVKDSEGAWQGHPMVVIKMEPANLILTHWIRPIYFTIEKAAPHRIFSYVGRTTPRIKIDGAWKTTDAEAVFDWP